MLTQCLQLRVLKQEGSSGSYNYITVAQWVSAAAKPTGKSLTAQPVAAGGRRRGQGGSAGRRPDRFWTLQAPEPEGFAKTGLTTR